MPVPTMVSRPVVVESAGVDLQTAIWVHERVFTLLERVRMLVVVYAVVVIFTGRDGTGGGCRQIAS